MQNEKAKNVGPPKIIYILPLSWFKTLVVIRTTRFPYLLLFLLNKAIAYVVKLQTNKEAKYETSHKAKQQFAMMPVRVS